jgi:hypothetical protein
MGLIYACVGMRADRPALTKVCRYVALIDVLGMKAWLETVPDSSKIAGELAAVINFARSGSSGIITTDARGPRPLGPLIGTEFFSDCILAYSADDSWTSASLILTFAKMLVEQALEIGIPLRGAISVGDTVFSKSLRVFVGQPLADADKSDKRSAYKGIGVHLTDRLVAYLSEKAARDSIPAHCIRDLAPEVFSNAADTSLLLWHRKALFIRNWRMFYKGIKAGKIRFLHKFNLRGLPADASEVRTKVAHSVRFLKASIRRVPSSQTWRSETTLLLEKELDRLNDLGLRDA